MKRTKLMSKLFSAECSDEFREKVLSGIDEAREKGECHCVDGDCDLHFADVNGDVIVEDQENDNEVTRFSENPEDENDLVMEAVDVEKELSDTEKPKEDPEKPEDKPEEPKEDPEKPEDKPEEPKEDPEKPEDKPEEPKEDPEEPKEDPEGEDKKFSDLIPAVTINVLDGPDGDHVDDIVDDLNVDVETGILCNEKSGTKKYSLNFKNFSESKARKIVKLFSEVIDQVNEMVDSADESDEPEVKTECDKTMSIKFGKKGIRIFSDIEDMEKPEDPKEDPEKPQRTFSEPEDKPKVTVQIENLEPASVASLLKPAGVGEERPNMDEKNSDIEPEKDPNGEGFSRQFSFTGNKKSINPLLFVEIK